MSGKRYFKVEYDEEWYLFDSDTISEDLVTEQAEYGYGVFANSLSPSEICERLNKQQARIKELEEENDILEQKLQTRYIVNKQYEEKERLKKENEQLRHEIEIEKKWQRAQDRYYVKIREENERLQKELDNFKPIIFKNMQKGTVILYSKGDVDD